MKIELIPIIYGFNRLELRVRYLIFVFILLAIFAADFFSIMNLQWIFLQKIGNDNQVIREEIAHLKGDLQKVDQMKLQLQHSRSQMEEMNNKIRSVNEISSILEDVSRMASESGIKIDQLTPQSEAQQTLISSGSIKYYALPIVIRATGGYHMFGHFMNQMESTNLFFALSDLTIEDQGGDINHHNINLTLKVILSSNGLKR